MLSFHCNVRSCFVELENHECMKVVMEKIAKLFPTYLMNPANRETLHPRNFCHLRYYYDDQQCVCNRQGGVLLLLDSISVYLM